MPKKTYYNQYNIEIRLWSSNHLCPLRWRLRSGIHERSTLMSTSPHWSSNILGTTASLPGHLDPGQMPRLWQPNNIINNQLGQHSNTHTHKFHHTRHQQDQLNTTQKKAKRNPASPRFLEIYIYLSIYICLKGSLRLGMGKPSGRLCLAKLQSNLRGGFLWLWSPGESPPARAFLFHRIFGFSGCCLCWCWGLHRGCFCNRCAIACWCRCWSCGVRFSRWDVRGRWGCCQRCAQSCNFTDWGGCSCVSI